MSETKEIKVNVKKKSSVAKIVLIIGILIIAIPCLVFVGVLGISALQTGSPRNGSRFTNDLVNEISTSDASTLEETLKSIGSIDSVEVKVTEGQLKIYIDTNDSLTESQVDAIVSDAYSKTIAKFPIATYFTRTDSSKMYDLQINVYTTAEATSNRQYKFLHKNSAEEQFQIDDLAHSKDPQLVAELTGTALPVETSDEEKPTE